MRPIELAPLLAISVQVLPLVDIGGGRRYVPFAGGSFTSAEIGDGRVLSGGVDWQLVRADGVVEIDAHYALEVESGDMVEVRATGLRHASTEVMEHLSRGEYVDPSSYYFRTAVRLHTSAPPLLRLNRVIAIATGERAAREVHIDVHEVR